TELKEFGSKVDVYDPNADSGEVKKEYSIDLINNIHSAYDVIILAVSHKEFANISWRSSLKSNGFIYDIKNFLGTEADYKL
ncbi:MAG: hypothetical protein KDD94_12315, partial [Calditrichaeota bacterium]|nr:hypothetical protein [Calditrichota bacterium]